MDIAGLKNTFLSLGLERGDIVLVASDIRKLLVSSSKKGAMISPTDIIEVLQEIVSLKGTLLFPVYNWDFCSGKGFDYKLSSGKTGTLGNTALHSESFHRTKHPIYSFAVWGKKAKELCALTNTDAFAFNSPFGFLHRHCAKMLMLDVECQNSLTFVHYVEQTYNVPYRFLKTFIGEYTDADGSTSSREYSMFVRRLEQGITTNLTGLERLLLKDGNMQILANSIIRLGCINNLERTYDLIAQDIEVNAARNLYSHALGD